MKKLILYIVPIVFLMTACYEEHDELTAKYSSGGGTVSFPEITEINSSFFDSFDFANAYIEFVVDVDGEKTESITIEKTFKGTTTTLETYTSFPATVNVSAVDAVADISGISVDDLVVGDVFTFEVLVTSKSGMTSRSNAGVLNAAVACASSLAGTYDAVTNGESTDPGPTPSENPAVDFASVITLTDTGVNGVYTISDFSGGLFTYWYDIYGLSGDYPGTIQDVCNSFTVINTTGPFGSPISGSGSVDPDTGVITISGLADSWGDNWTMVLTPQ